MPINLGLGLDLVGIAVEGPSEEEATKTRVTETGDERVTETGDVRVIEG